MQESYISSPTGIEEKSFALIREVLASHDVAPELLPVVTRVVHAAADFSLAELVESHGGGIEKIPTAFAKGGILHCDVQMLRAGISQPLCKNYGLETDCLIRDPEVFEQARKQGITRAMASIDMAVKRGIKLFAFGNAPTGLFRLLEHVREGYRVDAVIGMPVGFVGAAESKAALAACPEVPSIIVRGPRGGSTLCAAAINALLRLSRS